MPALWGHYSQVICCSNRSARSHLGLVLALFQYVFIYFAVHMLCPWVAQMSCHSPELLLLSLLLLSGDHPVPIITLWGSPLSVQWVQEETLHKELPSVSPALSAATCTLIPLLSPLHWKAKLIEKAVLMNMTPPLFYFQLAAHASSPIFCSNRKLYDVPNYPVIACAELPPER